MARDYCVIVGKYSGPVGGGLASFFRSRSPTKILCDLDVQLFETDVAEHIYMLQGRGVGEENRGWFARCSAADTEV